MRKQVYELHFVKAMNLHHLILLPLVLIFTILPGCGGYKSSNYNEDGTGTGAASQITVLGDVATVSKIKNLFDAQVGQSHGISGSGVGGNSNADAWITLFFADNNGLSQFKSWAANQKTYHFEVADGYYLLYISNTQAVRVFTQITGQIQAQ